MGGPNTKNYKSQQHGEAKQARPKNAAARSLTPAILLLGPWHFRANEGRN